MPSSSIPSGLPLRLTNPSETTSSGSIPQTASSPPTARHSDTTSWFAKNVESAQRSLTEANQSVETNVHSADDGSKEDEWIAEQYRKSIILQLRDFLLYKVRPLTEHFRATLREASTDHRTEDDDIREMMEPVANSDWLAHALTSPPTGKSVFGLGPPNLADLFNDISPSTQGPKSLVPTLTVADALLTYGMHTRLLHWDAALDTVQHDLRLKIPLRPRIVDLTEEERRHLGRLIAERKARDQQDDSSTA